MSSIGEVVGSFTSRNDLLADEDLILEVRQRVVVAKWPFTHQTRVMRFRAWLSGGLIYDVSEHEAHLAWIEDQKHGKETVFIEFLDRKDVDERIVRFHHGWAVIREVKGRIPVHD